MVGVGKPENQNVAIIFTRGEALQTIDMNQFLFFCLVYVKSRNELCHLRSKSSCKTFEALIEMHHEYIQARKGRDVGRNQISLFEAKVARGNGEQTLGRDIYRLSHRFDFFRMLSCYFTTTGFYVSSMMVVLTVYVFLYGRLYLSLSGLENSIIKFARSKGSDPLKAATASQSVVQIGLLMAWPMEMGLERGFRSAIGEMVIMQLQLAAVFFTFSLGTKVHYFGSTVLHGGAKYRTTGRGFVVKHEKFTENYRIYSRTHFVKALEIMLLLIVYHTYGSANVDPTTYMLLSFSMWFLGCLVLYFLIHLGSSGQR